MNKAQKLVIAVSILASIVAFLDGSIVNVALPAIARDLGGGLAVQQWVVDAYLLTLGSLILVAGSLSDIFSCKRVLVAGLIWFGIASLLCAVAPSSLFLIIARALQGVGGALIVPSSLALIVYSFSGPAQAKAIGIWTGWTGIAYIIAPLLGGFLVDSVSWRWIFAVNTLPIIVTLWLMRQLPKGGVSEVRVKIDKIGAVLGVLALAGPVYALIEQPNHGWMSPSIYVPLIAGVTAAVWFVWHERRVRQPMLPLGLFRTRNFTVGNLATTAIYAGMSVSTFLIIVFIQQVGGYSAIKAGLSLMPVTILMLILSGKFGTLAGKYGPRLFMSVGPLVSGLGFLLMLGMDNHVQYWTQLFPGVIVFGIGLSITVAPLTTAILGAVGPLRAGIASAINNAVARVAGLVAIALVGIITGPVLSLQGFRRGVIVMAVLLIAGGLISAIGIQNPTASEAK